MISPNYPDVLVSSEKKQSLILELNTSSTTSSVLRKTVRAVVPIKDIISLNRENLMKKYPRQINAAIGKFYLYYKKIFIYFSILKRFC